MAGLIVLIVWLAGLLPAFVWIAREFYKSEGSSYQRDGETMAFAAMFGVLGCGAWPVGVLGYGIHFLYKAGFFDIIFINQETRRQILLTERDERIRELEYQASRSPDEIYRRDQIEKRLPAKYRRIS